MHTNMQLCMWTTIKISIGMSASVLHHPEVGQNLCTIYIHDCGWIHGMLWYVQYIRHVDNIYLVTGTCPLSYMIMCFAIQTSLFKANSRSICRS